MKKSNDNEIIKLLIDEYLGENQEPKKITIKIELLDKSIDSEVEIERTFNFDKKGGTND